MPSRWLSGGQSNEREKWIEARESELLPVPYFHACPVMEWFGVVFTLPDILNQLCLHKDRKVYNILFESAWYVINKFGRDHKWLGAQTGMISILHTWAPLEVQEVHFRNRFIHYLSSNGAHKIAISNHRIKHFENGKVTFAYKDYRHGSVNKEMTLEATEFIRRFSMHILPKRFVRIRHYGILSSTSKASSITVIREQLPAITQVNRADRPAQIIYNPARCPCCKKDTMQTILRFNHRGPPPDWEQIAKQLLKCVS